MTAMGLAASGDIKDPNPWKTKRRQNKELETPKRDRIGGRQTDRDGRAELKKDAHFAFQG